VNKRVTPNQVDPTWVNVQEAGRFLQSLRPGGPWALTCIYVVDEGERVDGDVGPAPTHTFTDLAEAEAWIEVRALRANLYYHVNRTGQLSKKAGKTDISAVEYAHVDVDSDEHGALSGDPTRKARVIEALQACAQPGRPTFIVDSGGGVQALWRYNLYESTLPIADAEGINRALIDEYRGDRGTGNVDRLLRLPGTINFPDARKQARGRVPMPARLIETNDLSYDDIAFPTATKGIEQPPGAAIEFDAPEPIDDFEVFAHKYRLSPQLVELIRDGKAEGKSFPSRSEALFSVVIQLIRLRVPNEIILGIILDARFGISESVLDKPEHDQLRYAERQVTVALSKVTEEKAKDFSAFDDASLDELAANTSNTDGTEPWWVNSIVYPGQVAVADIPPTPWIVEGLLLERAVTILAGKGGVGKSTMCWHIAAALALGVSFGHWPAPTSPRKVLILSGEDDVDEIERRIIAACQVMGVDRSALKPNLMVWNNTTIRMLQNDQNTGKVSPLKLYAQVHKLARELDLGCVIIDPLIKVSQGFKESGNEDMEQVITHLANLAIDLRMSVLVCDHFSKGGLSSDQGAVRGASSKVDAARLAITLAPMSQSDVDKYKPPGQANSYVQVTDAKSNYSAKVGTVWYRMIPVAIGNGESRVGLRREQLFDKKQLPDVISEDVWHAYAPQIIEMIEEGRGDGKPWLANFQGVRASRLDIAVAEKFEIQELLARQILEAMDLNDVIDKVTWTDTGNRTEKLVWAIPEQPTEL
jgi:hypothetical protein